MAKKTLGRQKIELKHIENDAARQVCFSKRRAGLFKKASDAATLCKAEIGIITFSPGGNAFSFGHPSIGHILNRYQPGAAIGVGAEPPAPEAALFELSRRYEDLASLLEQQKKRRMDLEESLKDVRLPEVEEMGLEDLMAMLGKLQVLWSALAARSKQHQIARRQVFGPPPGYLALPAFAGEEGNVSFAKENGGFGAFGDLP